MGKLYYFDNAATTYPKPEEVYVAIDKANRENAFNAGRGSYSVANEASEVISSCRNKLISLFGAEGVVFEPSATLAFNAIIMGLDWSSPKNVYVSPYEHNAVIRPLYKHDAGNDIRILPVDENGAIDLDRLKIQFSSAKPDYVFISHVSNVTGYILPVAAICQLAHSHGAIVVVDCAQSAGLLETKLADFDADFIVFAGHKTLYASFGIAGFAYGKAIKLLTSAFAGGTGSDSLNKDMPMNAPAKFEAGSCNLPAIAGLSAALDWRSALPADQSSFARELELTRQLIYGLLENKRLKVYWTGDINNHISVVSINHRDYMADELASILDQDFHIAVRSGYHCAPLVHDIIGSKSKRGTVRISIGHFTTSEDVAYVIQAFSEL